MTALDSKYLDLLQQVADHVAGSEQLAAYLDEEEEELYKSFQTVYEPLMAEIHSEVSEHAPLQIIALEKEMLDPRFEGLFLPRILGYSVLRIEINDQYRYVRPNDHFKDVLLAICNSTYYEVLKKRIGQTIQTGFALSSDIWITNLMNLVPNKKIRSFLLSQKSDSFRNVKDRKIIYDRYARQFKQDFFYSAEFPENRGEMMANFSGLKMFLMKRFEHGGDNASLVEKIKRFLDNKDLQGSDEYLEVMSLYGNFIDRNDADNASLKVHFERERKSYPEFALKYLRLINGLYKGDLGVNADHDRRMMKVIDLGVKDAISDYYQVAEKIHSLGFVHPDAIETVQEFYDLHQGNAVETDCMRTILLNYIKELMAGLTAREYSDFFELTKIFALYMKILDNQTFNLEIERLSLPYVKELLTIYLDKRGKEYQDIKRAVNVQFQDMKFLSEKEVEQMFKTRRKRKPATE